MIRLYGQDAIDAVETQEGDLSSEQKVVVIYEGYTMDDYMDTKGIRTSGVGQTAEYIGRPFKEVYCRIQLITAGIIQDFCALPMFMKAELVAAAYRGDLTSRSRWVKLFNQQKYHAAAEELYRHAELQRYLKEREQGNPTAGGNIPERFKNLRSAILSMAE